LISIFMKLDVNQKEEIKRLLGRQPMLRNNLPAQVFLSKQGLVIEIVEAGSRIISEGERSRELVLLVEGQFRVDIGGAIVGDRCCTHVGEMAMIMEGTRSASVTAATPGRVIRVPENTVRSMLEKYPQIWEPLTETLCERLHARRLFFREANALPKMFIGSSGKNRKVAEALAGEIRLLLPADDAHISVWTEDIFQEGDVLITKLSEQAKTSDFGAFIFGADDAIVINPRQTASAVSSFTTRANVIFEAGMFVGACGLERTFIVKEKSKKMADLSDLGGVVYAEYPTGSGRAAALKKVAAKLAEAIRAKGVIRSTKNANF
jgi:predicted nucleotide-binding protein